MLLILGIRAVTDLFATPTYSCERCGRLARHTVLRERRRLSLFFIPVLTLGRARYIDECTSCGRLRYVSSEQAHSAPDVPSASGPQDSLLWTPQDR
jgi:hypothetical protein